MTAPVSLAEIKAQVPRPYVLLKVTERDALVELAEAYLETRPGIHDSCRPQCKNPDACEDRRVAASARLALAAKGVRP